MTVYHALKVSSKVNGDGKLALGGKGNDDGSIGPMQQQQQQQTDADCTRAAEEAVRDDDKGCALKWSSYDEVSGFWEPFIFAVEGFLS